MKRRNGVSIASAWSKSWTELKVSAVPIKKRPTRRVPVDSRPMASQASSFQRRVPGEPLAIQCPENLKFHNKFVHFFVLNWINFLFALFMDLTATGLSSFSKRLSASQWKVTAAKCTFERLSVLLCVWRLARHTKGCALLAHCLTHRFGCKVLGLWTTLHHFQPFIFPNQTKPW